MERRAAKLSLLNFLSLFRDLQKPTRFGGGGGVVEEFFRDPQKPTRRFSGVVAELFRNPQMTTGFSGGRGAGGGVVAELFRDPQKPTRFSGVVAGIFSYLQLRNLIFTPHSVIFVGT